MANKIPTAEEWLLNHKELSIYHLEEYDEGGYLGVNEEALYKIMIEFTKLHCEAQLKSILKNVKQEIACDRESTEHFNLSVKPSILNAYPLDKIK